MRMIVACRTQDGERVAELLLKGVAPVELGRQAASDPLFPWWSDMQELGAAAGERAAELVGKILQGQFASANLGGLRWRQMDGRDIDGDRADRLHAARAALIRWATQQ